MAKINKYTNKQGEQLYKFRLYAGIDELTGKQRYIRRQGFTSLKDAKNELLKLEYLVKTNQYFKNAKNYKFSDVLDEWLQLHRSRVKPSTIYTYQIHIKNYVLPYFENMYIAKITLRHCQDFTNKLFKKIPKSYKYAVNIVKNVLDYALKLGIIDNNPMLFIIKPKAVQVVEDSNKHENFYNRDELIQFLNTAKDTDLKKYALFRLLAFSGIRIGECLALNWHDVSFKNKTITINKTVTRCDGGLSIQTPKTKASNRVLSLDDETIQVLQKWQIEQRKQLLKIGINALDSKQLIFSNTQNKFITVLAVHKWLKNIAKKADVYPIKVHGFRHTHASLLFASGADIKTVQARLGHSNVTTTLNIYTHLTKNKKDSAGDVFAKFVNFS